MKSMKYLLMGVAGMAFTGAFPAYAADAPQAPSRTPVWACDITGFWELPGTDICFKVGGYAKADFIYTTDDMSDQTLFDVVSGLAAEARTPGTDPATEQVRFHAHQSRINFDARSNTEYGTVRAFVEFDFFGGQGNQLISNSQHPRLRHAYVQFGNLLAGQTWSTFMILSSLAETLDFEGPGGLSFIRQTQLRWTQPMGNGVTVSVALENPENMDLPRWSAGSLSKDELPDLVARIDVAQTWGSLHLAGVLRELQASTAAQSDEVGWAVGFGGRINVPVANGNDNVRFTAIYSDGGTRYLLDGALMGLANRGTEGFAERNALGQVLESYGGSVAFQHFWSNNLRSNFVASYVRTDNVTAALSTKESQYYAANLIWSPVPRVNIGLEVLHGRLELVNGSSADATRVQGSVQRSF